MTTIEQGEDQSKRARKRESVMYEDQAGRTRQKEENKQKQTKNGTAIGVKKVVSCARAREEREKSGKESVRPKMRAT